MEGHHKAKKKKMDGGSLQNVKKLLGWQSDNQGGGKKTCCRRREKPKTRKLGHWGKGLAGARGVSNGGGENSIGKAGGTVRFTERS